MLSLRTGHSDCVRMSPKRPRGEGEQGAAMADMFFKKARKAASEPAPPAPEQAPPAPDELARASPAQELLVEEPPAVPLEDAAASAQASPAPEPRCDFPPLQEPPAQAALEMSAEGAEASAQAPPATDPPSRLPPSEVRLVEGREAV